MLFQLQVRRAYRQVIRSEEAATITIQAATEEEAKAIFAELNDEGLDAEFDWETLHEEIVDGEQVENSEIKEICPAADQSK